MKIQFDLDANVWTLYDGTNIGIATSEDKSKLEFFRSGARREQTLQETHSTLNARTRRVLERFIKVNGEHQELAERARRGFLCSSERLDLKTLRIDLETALGAVKELLG